MIVVFSPAIGERYSLIDVAVYGVCLFLGGAVFFSLALLLSTVFDDLWRPLLLTCAVAFVLALGGIVLAACRHWRVPGDERRNLLPFRRSAVVRPARVVGTVSGAALYGALRARAARFLRTCLGPASRGVKLTLSFGP